MLKSVAYIFVETIFFCVTIYLVFQGFNKKVQNHLFEIENFVTITDLYKESLL